MRFSVVCVPFSILMLYLCYSNASFWDGVVGISQIKSAAQYIAGDKKGARETYRNFWNQMPVVSQIKSVGQVLGGNAKGAKKTQATFLRETVEPVVDNTPVVGHAKSLVHMAMGDKKHGYRIFRAASISALMVLAASITGPMGAIYAGLGSQGVLTLLESMASGKYRPVGVFEYVQNFRKKKVGDHVDFLADAAGSLYGGKLIKSNGVKFVKPKYGFVIWNNKVPSLRVIHARRREWEKTSPLFNPKNFDNLDFKKSNGVKSKVKHPGNGGKTQSKSNGNGNGSKSHTKTSGNGSKGHSKTNGNGHGSKSNSKTNGNGHGVKTTYRPTPYPEGKKWDENNIPRLEDSWEGPEDFFGGFG